MSSNLVSQTAGYQVYAHPNLRGTPPAFFQSMLRRRIHSREQLEVTRCRSHRRHAEEGRARTLLFRGKACALSHQEPRSSAALPDQLGQLVVATEWIQLETLQREKSLLDPQVRSTFDLPERIWRTTGSRIAQLDRPWVVELQSYCFWLVEAESESTGRPLEWNERRGRVVLAV